MDATDLSVMLTTGTEAVERELPTLNQINVFPVPDADTGTNLVHTLRLAGRELEKLGDSERTRVSAVAAAFARGAFAGAQGNSGVIMSEILRGFADGFADGQSTDGAALVSAFSRAAKTAYGAVAEPVEGTMLTVMRIVAEELTRADAQAGMPPADVIDRVVSAAEQAVEKTPGLLPVLSENGVVDAGALGLAVFFRGMRRGLGGSNRTGTSGKPAGTWAAVPHGTSGTVRASEPHGYGYCTGFVIRGEQAEAKQLREVFAEYGDSLVVAGGDGRIRVHLHTADPGAALSRAVALGSVHDISIRNMDEQAESQNEPAGVTELEQSGTRILVFASSEGFAAVFASLGASVVRLDADSDTETDRLVRRALGAYAGREVIAIATGEASRAAAERAAVERAAGQGTGTVHVVDVADPASAVAALMAYTYDVPALQNVEAMNAAARAATVFGASDAEQLGEVLREALAERESRGAVITLYYGRDVSPDGVKAAAVRVGEVTGETCEPVFGGQQSPEFLVCLE